MHKAKILLIEPVTHNVNRFILEKPKGYKFTPGQATNIAINKPGFKDKLHEFTFTSLNEDRVLEFTIKSYPIADFPTHKGVTEELSRAQPGWELLLENPWGTIEYKGKGVFFAGGAGITPFIAIFKDLHRKKKLAGNKLIFANKTRKDVILEKELMAMFPPENLVLVLSQEKAPDYTHGRVTESIIKKHVSDFAKNMYVCGPPKFTEAVKGYLSKLGAKSSSLVFEE